MTRYQQFVERQVKYRGRYERWRKNRRRIVKVTPLGFVIYRRSRGWDALPGTRGKQLRRVGAGLHHGPLLPGNFYNRYEVSTAERGKPPVVLRLKWYPPFDGLYPLVHPYNARVGYARRASRYFGKKAVRQTARDRVIRAADRFSHLRFISDGVRIYPWWDPLHRLPVGTESLDVAQDWSRFEVPPYY